MMIQLAKARNSITCHTVLPLESYAVWSKRPDTQFIVGGKIRKMANIQMRKSLLISSNALCPFTATGIAFIEPWAPRLFPR